MKGTQVRFSYVEVSSVQVSLNNGTVHHHSWLLINLLQKLVFYSNGCFDLPFWPAYEEFLISSWSIRSQFDLHSSPKLSFLNYIIAYSCKEFIKDINFQSLLRETWLLSDCTGWYQPPTSVDMPHMVTWWLRPQVKFMKLKAIFFHVWLVICSSSNILKRLCLHLFSIIKIWYLSRGGQMSCIQLYMSQSGIYLHKQLAWSFLDKTFPNMPSPKQVDIFSVHLMAARYSA